MKETDTEGFSKIFLTNLLTKPLHRIPDHRGSFNKLFIDNSFVEENIAISHRNVLRGVHYEIEGHRIFTPVYGRLYIVFLDLQENSPTKHDLITMTMDDSNRQSFLIPPYIGCGYLVLSDVCVIHYKWELEYNQSRQRTICYDDDRFNIYWPGPNDSFVLSERDYYADESLIR